MAGLGSAIIGALRVVIGADSAALSSDLDKARGQFGKFGQELATQAAVVTAAVAAAYTGLAISVSAAIDKMDAIGKQSQKLGIPVEQLSALSLAANTSDVAMDALGKSMGKLAKNITEGAVKPTSDAANAFRAIGLSAAEMGKKLPNEQLLILADKFKGIEDPTVKAALAIKIFGKAGVDMIPLLDMGARGIKDMMDAAAKFGIVIDTDTAKAAERFNDNLKKLSAAKDGLIVRLTAYMLPALEKFSERMLAAASDTGKQETKLSFLKTAFDALAKAIVFVTDNFGILLKGFAAFIAFNVAVTIIELGIAFVTLAQAIMKVGVAMAVLEVLRTIGVKIAAAIAVAAGAVLLSSETIRDKIKELGGSMLESIGNVLTAALEKLGFNIKGLGEQVQRTQDTVSSLEGSWANYGKAVTEVNAKLLAGHDAFTKYIDSVTKSTLAVQAEAQSVGTLAGTRERLQVIMQAEEMAIQRKMPLDQAEIALMLSKADAAGKARLQLEGLNLAYANRDPAVAFNDSMVQTKAKLDAVGASTEMVQRATKKLEEQAGVSWEAMSSQAANVAGSMATITGTMAKENKAMGIANKAFAISQAIINTAVAVSRANTLPPPASYAAMAVAAAAGAAQLATIMAQPGFATGGSFKIPGGAGGGDKVLTSMMLEPGEQVDVWRPGQGGGDDPRRGAGGNVTIRIDPGPMPREWVERLIYGINDAIGDGHRLKLA